MATTLLYLLYWALQAAAAPLLLLYLLRRIVRDRAYLRGLGERFGRLPASFRQTAPGCVWLHAVSVGEVLSAVNLLQGLQTGLPGVRVFVSVTTLAGRRIADERLRGLAAGVFYTPLDYRCAVRRVLRTLRPALVAVMETEIWPNLYREAKRSGAALIVINGRISDKAFPSYCRWRCFFRAALAWPDAILAQGPSAAARYRALGAPAERVVDAGNLKYDFEPRAHTPPAIAALLDAVQPGHVWIAASTMPPDEDDTVIAAFGELRERFPRLLLLLAPRRPELFDAAAAKLAAAGIPFLRRSALTGQETLALPGVLLLDTIGELAGLFPLAQAVFVGGSIVTHGGHNLLEPAVFGVPIVTGPYMQNFQEMAADFLAAGAVVTAANAAELAAAVARLLTEPGGLGARAAACANARRGATARVTAEMRRLHGLGLPRQTRWWAPLYQAGAALDRALTRPQRLPGPVVSVGNLAMGGAGKTPFVLWLVERLERPAILTRGYGRTSSRTLALAPGAAAAAAETGDEAQLFLRQGRAAVGVGADRAAAARQIGAGYTFILDDGFQHWRVKRDCDIVLIDGIDPYAGGLLREPFSALRRAHAIVVTRIPASPGLRELLRRHAPDTPVFEARFVPEPLPPLAGPIGAFCGLGQPESFRRTLAELGVEPAFFEVFPDHHPYATAEIETLSRRAATLLTTEKDVVRLPACPANVHAVRIRVEVDAGDALLRLLSNVVVQ